MLNRCVEAQLQQHDAEILKNHGPIGNGSDLSRFYRAVLEPGSSVNLMSQWVLAQKDLGYTLDPYEEQSLTALSLSRRFRVVEDVHWRFFTDQKTYTVDFVVDDFDILFGGPYIRANSLLNAVLGRISESVLRLF
jgi:hypothetical protein